MRISDWSSDVCSSDLLTEACSLRLSGEPRPQDVQGVADRRERIAQLVREDRQEFVLALIVEAQTLFGFGKVEEIAADLVLATTRPQCGVHEIGRASCRERVCQYV